MTAREIAIHPDTRENIRMMAEGCSAQLAGAELREAVAGGGGIDVLLASLREITTTDESAALVGAGIANLLATIALGEARELSDYLQTGIIMHSIAAGILAGEYSPPAAEEPR